MFKKTKRRIVFTVTFSLLILMTVTLATIYLSNLISVRRESAEMLETYVERFTLDNPGEAAAPTADDAEADSAATTSETGETADTATESAAPPKPIDPRGEGYGRNEPQFRLSTFYSVAYSKTGEVLAINNGDNGLKSQDELLSIASSILKSGKKSGTTGSMTYLSAEREDYTLVAFLDGTILENNRKTLFLQMLIIGAAATLVLLVGSVFIANRIVRPLEENDMRQKRFVSDAGHELKTPIAVTSANAELLRRQIGENEWLDNIEYENARMGDLVTQLLSLSRAEKQPKETLDFSALVEREILTFESIAFEKGKRITTNIAPALTATGNANQLRQLVSILLDNAISHGTGGEIRAVAKKEKHRVCFSVSNTAEEIPSEKLERLFDRFYRADESRSDGTHYGLGLSIAKAIATAHGGTIRANMQGNEITFTVTL